MTNRGMDETLTEMIVERLATDIVDGSILPGTKLKFSELRARYSVGLSPIREALFSLASQGFVEASSRRGFRVAQVSYEDLADLIDVRIMVELAALRQAIALGRNEWEDEIVSSFARLKRAIDRAEGGQDWGHTEINATHKQFHLSLTAASTSRRLRSLQRIYYDQASRYRYLMQRSLGDLKEFLDVHEQLMTSVLARDTETAVAQLADHLKLTLLTVYPMNL